MKSGVKFTSITTGYTSEFTFPYFNSLLEAQQFLINIAVNLSNVSAELLTASADAETQRLTLATVIPETVSACVCMGYGALTPVNENGTCNISEYPHLALYTKNSINLDADTYNVNGTTIALTENYGGWADGTNHSYKAIGVSANDVFYPANNITMCNQSRGNIGRYDVSSSMGFGLFLPCIIPLTDGNITLQFINLTTTNLYVTYNSTTGSFISRDRSWWANQTMKNIYYIINAPKPDQPSISGDPTAEIDTDTGESETQDSEDNVGGAGNVTLINNVVNYDNYTPNYARVNTGFITPFEVDPTNLDTLHSFLYSETILDLVKNYFAGDATKAIVDLFNIPIAPAVEANSTEIKVGVVGTGARGNVLTSETATFDFGSIDITQGYNSNSFMDLDPYNKYMIFLPFIGFKTLNTNDIRSINDTGFKIYLKYIVDMLTGDFVAVIEADHNNAVFDNDTGTLTTAKLTKQVINTFSGNMRTAIPLNSINSREAITPALGALATAIAGASTGNPLVMAQSVGSSLNSMANYNNALIPRGDSLSGNIGNLTINKAFVINQESPKYIRTGKSNQLVGYPVYKYMKITKDRGYVKVKDLIMSGFTGTAKEAEALEALLKGGVWTE